MSLRLLIDEDTQHRVLVRMLRQAGHDVQTVSEAGLEARSDSLVLAHAVFENRIVITRNVEDFRRLHRDDPSHQGIFVICEDKDRSKNMEHDEIVRAITNVEASGWDVVGQLVALNAWNFQPPRS